MSQRTRRSTGNGELGSLNPAMIQLYDISRLREELEIRGLDTKGNKQTLADRLEDAVRMGKSIVAGLPMDISPEQKPRSVKRKAEVAEVFLN